MVELESSGAVEPKQVKPAAPDDADAVHDELRLEVNLLRTVFNSNKISLQQISRMKQKEQSECDYARRQRTHILGRITCTEYR